MYRITRDQPGQALEIEWKGFHFTVLFRGCYTLVGLPIIALGVVSAVSIARGEPFNCLFLALWATPFFILVPWASGFYMGYEHRIAWDKVLTLSCKGPYLFLRWTCVIPFPEIRSIKLQVEEPNVTRLWLTHEKGRRLRSRTLMLQVEGLDRRDEAMDLLFRVGRIIGWPSYRVLRNDPRAMEIELIPSGEGNPVPEAAGPADYSKPHEVFHETPATMPPFDLDRLKSTTGYEVKAWKPGQRIHLVERPRTVPEWMGAVLMGPLAALAVYLVMTVPVYFAPALAAWYWPAAGVACAVGAGWGCFATRRRRIELDWKSGTARFARSRRVRTVPLGAIEEIVLRGRLTAEHEGPPRQPGRLRVLYLCDMMAILPGPDEVLLRTRPGSDPDSPYHPTLAATVELARALDVPWRWEPYR